MSFSPQNVREISNLNFEECFPKIKEILEVSTFIAFDAEFTGISADELKRNSLFDTPEERYTTMLHNIKDFVISQFGLTAFQFDRATNKYSAHTFVFYLFPRSVGTLHRSFNAETSAFEFLSQFGFDFKKLMGSGVTYLNAVEEKKVYKELRMADRVESLEQAIRDCKNKPVGKPFPILTREELLAINEELEHIQTWLASDKEDDALLEGLLCTEKFYLMDNLKDAIDIMYPFLLVTSGFDKVTRKSAYVYQDTRSNPQKFIYDLMNEKIGFSRVFKLLVSLKKPFVGHNPILDLMLMYNQFYAPLPKEYRRFKKTIHALFPQVFDTKYISYEMRDLLNRETVWESNDLEKLYLYFESGVGSYVVKHSPQIHLAGAASPTAPKPKAAAKKVFHEAGWDSYYTGYCFVRMMHFYAVQTNIGCGMNAKPLTSVQHLYCVRSYKNRVNISRANINSIFLAGPDPKSKKPQWLVVELKDKAALKNESILDLVVSYTDVSLDVKLISQYQVMIAVNSLSAARDLRQVFVNKKDFSVSAYNPLKHNRIIRNCLWAGIISSVSIGAILVLLGKQTPKIDIPSF